MKSRPLSRSILPWVFAVLACVAGDGKADPREGSLQDAPAPIAVLSSEDLRGATANERSIIEVLNEARADPDRYAKSLGGAGAAEARAFLRGLSPLPPVVFSEQLSAAALSHVNIIGPQGLATHSGLDGSTPGGRVRQRGFISTMVAEELAFGTDRPADVIRNLVLDRDVAGAPHRRDLFNPVFTHAGAACGPHRTLRRVCVVVLSSAPMQPPAGPPTTVAAPVTKLCWINSKTGKVVPDTPPRGAQVDLADPRRAHNPTTGDNFHRGADGSWVNSKTGRTVVTPPQGAELDLTDPRRAHDPRTGDNYHRGPCPPPKPVAPPPPRQPEKLCWFNSKSGKRVRDWPYMSEESGDPNHAHRASTGDNFHRGADGSWVNSRTGAKVRSYPYMAEESGDPNHAHRASTGDNFHRAPCPTAP